MDGNIYSINNMKNMEIIDVKMGARLGMLRDIKVNCDQNKIESIYIPMQKNSIFGKMELLEIAWEDIIKIGLDVILVDTKGKLENNE